MIDLKEFIGLPIISSDDKKLIGETKDILYKNIHDKIIGILVDEGGFFRKPKIIFNDNIITIDEKVIVDSLCSLIEIGDENEFIDIVNGKYDIVDMEVYDLNGCFAGKVYDLVIDECSRMISYVKISKGFSIDLFRGLKIISTDFIRVIDDKIILTNNSYSIKGGIKNLIKI